MAKPQQNSNIDKKEESIRRCFNCDKEEHIVRDCQFKRENYMQQITGKEEQLCYKNLNKNNILLFSNLNRERDVRKIIKSLREVQIKIRFYKPLVC